MTTLKAALEALTADSGRWSEVSGDLQTASTSAYGLDIHQWSFPSQMDINLQPLYTQVQEKVAKLLAGGADETAEISNELLRVKKVLKSTDEAAKQDLESVWDYDG
jgi:hypothetical protein